MMILQDLDAQDQITRLVLPGAQLALDMLDDDIASTVPRCQLLLLQHALAILDCPPDKNAPRLVDNILRLCRNDDRRRSLVEDALESRVIRQPNSPMVLLVLALLEQGKGPLPAKARRLLTNAIKKLSADQRISIAPFASQLNSGPLREFGGRPAHRSASADSHTLSRLLSEHAKRLGLHVKQLKPLLERLENAGVQMEASYPVYLLLRDGMPLERGVLEGESVREAVRRLVRDLDQQDWNLSSALRLVLEAWIARRAVGGLLVGFD